MVHPSTFLTQVSRGPQWAILLGASAFFSAMLELGGLPAALLLGPMLAAVLIETAGGRIRVAPLLHYGAQAVIGCLVARAITPAILHTFLTQWPLFIGVILAIIFASSLLGWFLSKWKVLPGTTAIWGLSPGAASAMMLMAEAFGADSRLVAFMQYLRVVFVAFAASVVARFWVHASSISVKTTIWFPTLHWITFGETLSIMVIGGMLGHKLRIPAGAILVPMAAAAILQSTGFLTIELPPWLLAACYACLGWKIGLGFTRKILRHAARALPKIIPAILAVMLFCGGLAYLLVIAVGIDPLTAYLATSPGGMDSVAIIAASSKVDLSFVMTLQIVRMLAVLLIGPYISRFIARRLSHEITTVCGTESMFSAAASHREETLAEIKENEGELD